MTHGLTLAAAILVTVGIITFMDEGDEPPSVLAAPIAAPVPVVSPSEDGNAGCSVPTVAPDPEPCLAVQNTIKTYLFNLQGGKQFQLWKRDNPGEFSRITAYMATGTAMAPISTGTFLGASIRDAVQAYLYARGAQPLAWPAAPPKPQTTGDTKPPSAPGITSVENDP